MAGAETGLDYAFARYYNSRIGRFMSADPLEGDISDPQTHNRFAYARNDPMNLVDPLGLRMTLDSCHSTGNPYCGDASGGVWEPGILACGVDPFCIDAGGIGPFGSPVANGASWTNSTYLAGGGFLMRVWTPDGRLVQNCVGSFRNMDCFWAPYSIQYVINGDQHLVIRNGVAEFVGNETRLRSLAKGVVAGAGGIGDPRVIAGWYLASAAIGGAIYAGLPAAPKVVAAGTQASAAATVAGEAYIGWQNIYRFTSGFVNTNTPPLTEAAFWGNWAGKIFRLLIRQ